MNANHMPDLGTLHVANNNIQMVFALGLHVSHAVGMYGMEPGSEIWHPPSYYRQERERRRAEQEAARSSTPPPPPAKHFGWEQR